MNKVKKASAFTAIALLTTGLSACNANEGALDTRYNNNAQPMGYYSNENTNVDNEGPVTEMMDGMNNGRNGNNVFRGDNRYDNRNIANPAVPFAEGHDGTPGDRLFSRNDANYHGHLNNVGNRNNGNNITRTNNGNNIAQTNNGNNVGNENRNDGEISRKIRNTVEKMDNVDNARVLVTEDNVLVAIDTNEQNNHSMKENITKKVRKMADGRNVQVVTDEGTFTRVRNIDNDIQNGVDRKTIDADINNLMDDLGDAIQRPFNGNR